MMSKMNLLNFDKYALCEMISKGFCLELMKLLTVISFVTMISAQMLMTSSADCDESCNHYLCGDDFEQLTSADCRLKPFQAQSELIFDQSEFSWENYSSKFSLSKWSEVVKFNLVPVELVEFHPLKSWTCKASTCQRNPDLLELTRENGHLKNSQETVYLEKLRRSRVEPKWNLTSQSESWKYSTSRIWTGKNLQVVLMSSCQGTASKNCSGQIGWPEIRYEPSWLLIQLPLKLHQSDGQLHKCCSSFKTPFCTYMDNRMTSRF